LKTQRGVGELPSILINLQEPLLVALGEEKSWEEEKILNLREKTCLNTHFQPISVVTAGHY